MTTKRTPLVNKITSLIEERNELNAEITRLKVLNESTQCSRDEYRAEWVKLRPENQELKTKLKNLTADYNALDKAHNELKTEIDALKSQLAKAAEKTAPPVNATYSNICALCGREVYIGGDLAWYHKATERKVCSKHSEAWMPTDTATPIKLDKPKAATPPDKIAPGFKSTCKECGEHIIQNSRGVWFHMIGYTRHCAKPTAHVCNICKEPIRKSCTHGAWVHRFKIDREHNAELLEPTEKTAPSPICNICKEPIRLTIGGSHYVHYGVAKTHLAELLEPTEFAWTNPELIKENAKLNRQLGEIYADAGLKYGDTHESIIQRVREHREDARKFGAVLSVARLFKSALEGV